MSVQWRRHEITGEKRYREDIDQMRFNDKRVRFVTVGVMLAALAVVSGCREEEQGRILVYEKGTYLGKPDQKLPESTQQELRSRARKQAF